MIIVYCATRNIYHLLPTAIGSVLKHNEDKIKQIYVLIEDDNIEYINHPLIKFINCNQFDFLLRDHFNCSKRFPYMAMTRCYLTKILNEDKIIYLDVDTIVNKSLQELWDYDLENTCIAARAENKNGYFNSGVLLMNLKKIRELELDKTLDYHLKTSHFQFPDQDALNITFKFNKVLLPQKFNVMGHIVYNMDKIVIRHFCGVTKPWEENADEADIEYWRKNAVTRL